MTSVLNNPASKNDPLVCHSPNWCGGEYHLASCGMLPKRHTKDVPLSLIFSESRSGGMGLEQRYPCQMCHAPVPPGVKFWWRHSHNPELHASSKCARILGGTMDALHDSAVQVMLQFGVPFQICRLCSRNDGDEDEKKNEFKFQPPERKEGEVATATIGECAHKITYTLEQEKTKKGEITKELIARATFYKAVDISMDTVKKAFDAISLVDLTPPQREPAAPGGPAPPMFSFEFKPDYNRHV